MVLSPLMVWYCQPCVGAPCTRCRIPCRYLNICRYRCYTTWTQIKNLFSWVRNGQITHEWQSTVEPESTMHERTKAGEANCRNFSDWLLCWVGGYGGTILGAVWACFVTVSVELVAWWVIREWSLGFSFLVGHTTRVVGALLQYPCKGQTSWLPQSSRNKLLI